MGDVESNRISEAESICRSAVAGSVCLLEACRGIVDRLAHLGFIDDALLDPIIAVESELGDVPGSAAYGLWEARALRRKLLERDEYLERVRPVLLDCFDKILAELGKR